MEPTKMITLVSFLGRARQDPKTDYKEATYRFPHIRCFRGPDQAAEEVLKDTNDLQSIKHYCSNLLKEMLARHTSNRTCVDVTGGTVPMSVGAFQVAEELSITSVYLLGTHSDSSGQAKIRHDHVAERNEGIIVILSDHRGEDGHPEDGR